MIGPTGPIGPQGLAGLNGWLLFYDTSIPSCFLQNKIPFIREQAKMVLAEKMVNLVCPVLLVKFYERFYVFETI